MSDLETRVRRLERWNRVLMVGMAIAGAGALIAANAAPERLTVRGLTVVDDQGRSRATFSCGDDDVSLSLVDPAGNERLVVACGADSVARLELLPVTGSQKIRLLCNAERWRPGKGKPPKSDGIEMIDMEGDRSLTIKGWRNDGGAEIKIKDMVNSSYWKAPTGFPVR